VAIPAINPEHRDDSTIADGCDVKVPGEQTYEVVKHLVDEFILVTEEEIEHVFILKPFFINFPT
jgi:threonine dehydratase